MRKGQKQLQYTGMMALWAGSFLTVNKQLSWDPYSLPGLQLLPRNNCTYLFYASLIMLHFENIF